MKWLTSRFKKVDKKFIYLDILIVLFILILPYYIFEGKLFIGGDETRLQYVYPIEWIKNIYFYSWYSFAPLGTTNSIQFTIPFLTIFTFLNFVMPSKIIVNYLAFSSPLILGYLFFIKFINETNIQVDSWTSRLGALFYIFSPILIYKIINPFLFAAWLIGFIPLIGYLYIKYLKFGNLKFVLLSVLTVIFLAIIFNAIPWIVGFLIPMLILLPFIFIFFSKKSIFIFIKRTFIFVFFIIITQLFWLISYSASFFAGSGSYTASILSDNIKSSFVSTVLATSGENNIFYPMLNLFHRGLAFSSNWALKDVYNNFYDLSLYLNIIFPLIIILGLLNHKKILSLEKRKIYFLSFIAFILSLFLFTVNIGPFKNAFLWLGDIPGFVMFRNFYGKFSIAYVIYFSLFFTLSLHIVVKKYNFQKNILYFILFLVIFINFIPIKQNINIPLWQTANIYTVLNLPGEYLDFIDEVKNKIPQDTAILSIPLNVASYSIIKDENSNNIYAGSSPIMSLSKIPTFAGNFSFSYGHDDRRRTAQNINKWIQQRDYEKLNELLYKYNIGYILVTKNIPSEVKESFLFNPRSLPFQDDIFVDKLAQEEVIRSSRGNYILYKTNISNALISSPNLTYQKVNPVKYRLYINNLNDEQELKFLNTFNTGWKLFIRENPNASWCKEERLIKNLETISCDTDFSFLEPVDLSYSFTKDIFQQSHAIYDDYANEWTLTKDEVISSFDKRYYLENDDGSIDVELILYFVPQNYFYFGTILSIFSISILTILIILKRKK